MLFPTHKRAGIAFGAASSLAIIGAGIYANQMSDKDLVLNTAVCTLLIIKGGMFGAEFPDCDSPRSLPTQHYPWINYIFRLCHVNHRGKFSHSILSATLFWSALAVLMSSLVMIGSKDGNLVLLVQMFIVLQLATIIKEILLLLDGLFNSKVMQLIGLLPFLEYIATADDDYARQAGYKKPNQTKKIVFFILSIILASPLITILGDTQKDLMIYILMFILGCYVGHVSHWFCDLSTKAGVWVGWKTQIKPIKFLSHIPIFGPLMIPDEGKTGSKWENRYRFLMSALDLFLIFALVTAIFAM